MNQLYITSFYSQTGAKCSRVVPPMPLSFNWLLGNVTHETEAWRMLNKEFDPPVKGRLTTLKLNAFQLWQVENRHTSKWWKMQVELKAVKGGVFVCYGIIGYRMLSGTNFSQTAWMASTNDKRWRVAVNGARHNMSPVSGTNVNPIRLSYPYHYRLRDAPR